MNVLWTLLKNYTNQLLENFKKEQFIQDLKDSICSADLIFGLFLWKIKKGVTITNAFQKILKESSRKPSKIWVNKGSEFCNNSVKKWLKDNDIEMYSIHNEGKYVVAKRFIRTLKTRIYLTWLQYQKMCISIN